VCTWGFPQPEHSCRRWESACLSFTQHNLFGSRDSVGAECVEVEHISERRILQRRRNRDRALSLAPSGPALCGRE
jgi:hypothetical protein